MIITDPQDLAILEMILSEWEMKATQGLLDHVFIDPEDKEHAAILENFSDQIKRVTRMQNQANSELQTIGRYKRKVWKS